MASITAVELGADTCALARASVRRDAVQVFAVETLDPIAFPGSDSFTLGLRQVRRALKLPKRCSVVVWGLPEGAGPGDPAVQPILAPLVGAGFKINRVVSPCNALAALARLRRSRGDGATCWLAINRGGVAIVVVRPGKQLFAHSFVWDSTIGLSGSQARLLQRYSLVSFLSPEIKRAMEEARNQGTPVDAVVTCGNLPDLRSLTMPLIEELDVEVETLDSLEGLIVSPAVSERLTELAPAIRLACAGALARGTRPWDASKRRAAQGAIVLFRAAAVLVVLSAAAVGFAWYQNQRHSRPAAPTAPIVQNTGPRPPAAGVPGAATQPKPSAPARPIAGPSSKPAAVNSPATRPDSRPPSAGTASRGAPSIPPAVAAPVKTPQPPPQIQPRSKAPVTTAAKPVEPKSAAPAVTAPLKAPQPPPQIQPRSKPPVTTAAKPVAPKPAPPAVTAPVKAPQAQPQARQPQSKPPVTVAAKPAPPSPGSASNAGRPAARAGFPLPPPTARPPAATATPPPPDPRRSVPLGPPAERIPVAPAPAPGASPPPQREVIAPQAPNARVESSPAAARPLPPLLKDPIPRVTAILVSSDRRFATVNEGQIIEIGDVLGRRIVMAIDERAVVLQEPSGVQIRVGLGGRVLSAGWGR